MLTRADYMEKRCTYHEYYSEVAKAAGVGVPSDMFPAVRDALAKGDHALNTIPLATWDKIAERQSVYIATALAKRGDGYSLAGGVCAIKVAAINKARERAEPW